MDSKELYTKLESDFIKPYITDDWSFMNVSKLPYVTDLYKKRFMGLFLDFAPVITKAYTAVFPSKEVLDKLEELDAKDCVLFVHHPASWDSRNESIFANIPLEYIEKLKARKIAVYNLHSPLDNYSDYSTSNTLNKALWLNKVWLFVKYEWWMAWIISTHNFADISELKKHFEEIVWHEVWLKCYWDTNIKGNKIWVVAWWWTDMDVLPEMKELWIDTLVTWVSYRNPFTAKALDFARENAINILAWTHYSTEKFACIAMVDYFKELGLEAIFIGEEPIFKDFE